MSGVIRKPWAFLRAYQRRLVLVVLLALAAVNTGLGVSAALARRNSERVAVQVRGLQANLIELRRVEQEGLSKLQAAALEEESWLRALRAGFPDLGEPFDLFRRGFALAGANDVQVLAVEREETTTEESPLGWLQIDRYSLRGVAELQDCLTFAAELEAAGLGTLALDRLFLAPQDLRCDFHVILASSAPEAPGAEP